MPRLVRRQISRLVLACAFSGVVLATATPPATAATQGPHSGETRTANREVEAPLFPWPRWMIARPDYFEFTPMVSNHDPLHSHPAADGQNWDPQQWPQGWTADRALRRFYASGIFTGQNLSAPVREVSVGPTFFKLSSLDQNRTLKLLTDEAGVFTADPTPIHLRDHASGKRVGTYGQTGLQLY